MTSAALKEKIISAIFVVLSLTLLTENNFRELYILLGQGHFVATYFYQYKAGKINSKYIFAYLLTFTGIFFWYENYGTFPILEFITASYFIVHFLFDERHLLGEAPSKLKGFELLPFWIIFTGELLDFDFGLDVSKYFCLLGMILVLLNYFLVVRNGKFKESNLYFLILTAIVLTTSSTHIFPYAHYIIGSVILYHYSNWYLNYYFRYAKDLQKRDSYLKQILIFNIPIIIAFFTFKYGAEFPETQHFTQPMKYFFQADYFYIWTLMHLIFTTRVKDFAYFGFTKRN